MQPERRPKLDATQRPRPVMDIRPTAPITPPPISVPSVAKTPTIPSTPQPQPIDDKETKPKPHRSKLVIISIVLIVIALLGVGGYIGVPMWYQAQLQPISSDKNAARIRVTIESGSTPDQIAKLLQEKGLIRSDLVFIYYTRDKGVQSKLQAGTFNLKPSDSLPDIVDHLVAGKTDEFSITFLPGDTVAGHRKALIKAGYSEGEVDAALKKTYDHPIFAGKPAETDLEGYIYGETYNFTADATVEQILTRTFDELEAQVKKYDLAGAYQKHGLTLYQGITLASIIQREVAGEADEKQVAQVFYKRLNDGGRLGSDVTYIYAAKKLGVEATPELDSPYNTRIHAGLPPGPISSPGLSALLATASPAAGDYTYFLAGDDGKTYFAHTYEEHQANIVNHCKKNCQ